MGGWECEGEGPGEEMVGRGKEQQRNVGVKERKKGNDQSGNDLRHLRM